MILSHRFNRRVCAGAILVAGATGCKDLAGSSPLPAGTSDPGVVASVAGAVALSVGAHAQFQSAVSRYIPASGLLTDELQAASRGPATLGGTPTADVQIDARLLSQESNWSGTSTTSGPVDGVYEILQTTRATTSEAIGALTKYAPDSTVRRGELYALAGYSEMMLADMFCSGIPLSTFDFEHDFTYRAGSTPDEVYRHAIALFDSAKALATASSTVTNLANVGAGRAHLQLGEWNAAALAVADVPTAFVYADTLPTATPGNDVGVFFVARFDVYSQSVGDRDGISGRPYVSSNDPRTAAVDMGPSPSGNTTIFSPAKYLPQGQPAVVPIASGLEAQLIAAEAALQNNHPERWLSILQTLRQDSASTAALPQLVDPGTPEARVDTLFSERAAWLFLTGHRQGDLRRLVQRYGRNKGQVYPHGPYPGLVGYGTYIDAAIPRAELTNPLFHGCLNRG